MVFSQPLFCGGSSRKDTALSLPRTNGASCCQLVKVSNRRRVVPFGLGLNLGVWVNCDYSRLSASLLFYLMKCLFVFFFVTGLQLKCEASIHQIYHESTERFLEEDRPRILATGSSSGHNPNMFQSSVYDGELTDQGDRYLTMNGYKGKSGKGGKLFEYFCIVRDVPEFDRSKH